MKKAILYTIPGCHECEKAKKDIRKRKKEGRLCYDIEYKNALKIPEKKLPKGLEVVPMMLVDGRLKDYKSTLDKCPIKK